MWKDSACVSVVVVVVLLLLLVVDVVDVVVYGVLHFGIFETRKTQPNFDLKKRGEWNRGFDSLAIILLPVRSPTPNVLFDRRTETSLREHATVRRIARYSTQDRSIHSLFVCTN